MFQYRIPIDSEYETVTQMNIAFSREPENMTVTEGSDVAVPCIANTTLLPSWRINDSEYGSDVGLPTYFILNATHLLVPSIALFLTGTVVQCFFVQYIPSVGLVKTFSDVGVITVTKGK